MMKPVALTIAGSDNSAGAGIQADLKTFSACGLYGTTALTCVVSENSRRVTGIQAVRPALVAAQIATAAECYSIRAAKTGMLYNHAIIDAIVPGIKSLGCPLVVDPVMVATSGAPLLQTAALKAVCRKIIPLACLVTPNLDEAKLLLSACIDNLREARRAVIGLYETYGVCFLLKGGHLKGRMAVDLYYDGKGIVEYASPFVRGVDTHGTGCTYSAAICAGLAKGLPLAGAIAFAKQYITGALKHAICWKNGQSALNHFWLP